MIWHEEDIQSLSQPPEVTMKLIGTFNPPGGLLPIITINLHIQQESDEIIKELFNKNPSGLVHEEPNADDIKIQYHRKLSALKLRVLNQSYEDILQW